jgi:RNA polymerase sigma-70 factor (ECF subfamily)
MRHVAQPVTLAKGQERLTPVSNSPASGAPCFRNVNKERAMQATLQQKSTREMRAAPTFQAANTALTSLTDEQLIEMYRLGDRKAFDTLIHRYERQIYNLAYRMSRNYDDAQEITSEAFLRICQNLPSVEHAITLPAWINRIVVNVYINMHRHARRRPATSLEGLQEKAGDAVFLTDGSENGSLQKHAEATERAEILKRAIAALPPSHRPLVTLFHSEGRTYEEIARAMRIPTGTVKSRLNRARLALRHMLAPQRTALVG